ncbi:hypothetical protein HPC49_41980, partial [Pyxidicoccus fallax]
GYTALEDPGEWTDTGPYSACAFLPAPSTVTECSDLANYDLSGCDTASLGRLEPEGIYQVELRNETRLQDGGVTPTPSEAGFQLFLDGRTPTLSGRPLTTATVEPGRFFLEYTLRYPNGAVESQYFVGCRAPDANRVDGCYVRCLNGRVNSRGTFDAARMKWRDGEAESSGGLRLRSETPVPNRLAVDVWVTRGHAYVVSLGWNGEPGGLAVFDVSNPDQPVLTTSMSLPADNAWNGVGSKDDALYVASADTGVVVFDISNPARPVLVRSVPGGGPVNVHTLFVEGNQLYATQQKPGTTLLFDISRPLEPVLLNTFSLPQSQNPSVVEAPQAVFASEGRAYVCHAVLGYVVFDVRVPSNIVELGRYSVPLHGSHATALATMAGRTVAFEGGDGHRSHLRVLDVTDPEHIVKMGEFRLRPHASIHDFVLRGTRLYVAWYQEGLRVLDVSNPTQPKQVAHYNTFRETDPGRTDRAQDGASGIRVPGDGRVYLVDTSRGLLIFDEP